MLIDYVKEAHNHIANLIAGVMFISTNEYNNEPSKLVRCEVTHPKRTIDPTSFVRSAKKQGLIANGTHDACNRNKFIVAYVTVADGSAELCIKGTNQGHLEVEVRFKGIT
jgi:hypothetical protein